MAEANSSVLVSIKNDKINIIKDIVCFGIFDRFNGTTDVDNIASQNVIEKCGYILVNVKEMPVHVLDEKFRYYRYYRKEEI